MNSDIRRIKLPLPESTPGQFLIYPLDQYGEPGWNISEQAKFELTLNYFFDSKKRPYSFLSLNLIKITKEYSRPVIPASCEHEESRVCDCDECMKVHKDKKMHYKTKIIYKAKKTK